MENEEKINKFVLNCMNTLPRHRKSVNVGKYTLNLLKSRRIYLHRSINLLTFEQSWETRWHANNNYRKWQVLIPMNKAMLK